MGTLSGGSREDAPWSCFFRRPRDRRHRRSQERTTVTDQDRYRARDVQGDTPGGRGEGGFLSGSTGGHRGRTAYLGDDAVQTQLVLGEALVEGAQLGQGVPQRGVLHPQLGHRELQLHAASLGLQGRGGGARDDDSHSRMGERGEAGRGTEMGEGRGWRQEGAEKKEAEGRDPQRGGGGEGRHNVTQKTIATGLLPMKLLKRSHTRQSSWKEVNPSSRRAGLGSEGPAERVLRGHCSGPRLQGWGRHPPRTVSPALADPGTCVPRWDGMT